VRGIARMVEEDKYCIDVLTQISASTSSLRAVGCSSSRIISAAASSMATREPQETLES